MEELIGSNEIEYKWWDCYIWIVITEKEWKWEELISFFSFNLKTHKFLTLIVNPFIYK